MFDKIPDERLSAWAEHRHALDTVPNPLELLIEFWGYPPYVPFNRNVDPYNQRAWPTPWEIIVENKYDDFTKALMMSWTLKLTARSKDVKIELKTYTDDKRQYNLVVINDEYVVNYKDNVLSTAADIPEWFQLENLIEVSRPR